MTLWPLREELHRICRLLDDKGFIAANDGNVSARLENGLYLVTPTGMRKSLIRPEQLLIVDREGKVVDGPEGLVTTSEFRMHVRIYDVRPDVNAVVHAHPPVATGYALQRRPLAGKHLPEIIFFMDEPGLAPYGTPGTDALADAVEDTARIKDSFLMANHGAVGIGTDLKTAWWNLERIEHYAKIYFTSEHNGKPYQLSEKEVNELLALKNPKGEGK